MTAKEWLSTVSKHHLAVALSGVFVCPLIAGLFITKTLRIHDLCVHRHGRAIHQHPASPSQNRFVRCALVPRTNPHRHDSAASFASAQSTVTFGDNESQNRHNRIHLARAGRLLVRSSARGSPFRVRRWFCFRTPHERVLRASTNATVRPHPTSPTIRKPLRGCMETGVATLSAVHAETPSTA